MKCDKTSEITAYLKGEVADSERETLRLHFDQCPACTQDLAKFDRVLKALGRMEDVEPSQGFKWRVREAFLRAHPEFLEAPRPERLTWWQSVRATINYVPAWASSIAAHVVLFALAAILFLAPRSEEEEWEARVVQTRPRDPGPGAPSFEPGGKPAPRPDRISGSVPVDDPTGRDFNPGEPGTFIRPPMPPPNPALDRADASKWRERMPRDRRLLAFFEGRASDSQRETLRAAFGGQGTEKAIRDGLNWLARAQQPDGRWEGPLVRNEQGVESTYAVGLTGLSLMAYLAEGHTGKSGDYAMAVRRGLDFLLAQQRQSGQVGSERGNYMYNHALAAIALTEAAMMTKDEALGTAASMAVAFTISSQNATGGWGYAARSPDNDTSVSGWQVLLLRLAKLGGNQGVIGALVQANHRLRLMTDSEDRVRYRDNLRFPNGHRGLTAVGMFAHQMSTHTPDPELLARQAGILLEQTALPAADPAAFALNDLYFAHFGSLALHQVGGAAWTQWWMPLQERLLRLQSPDGSWPQNLDRWHLHGGQVYTTAISILTLQTPVRYPRLAE